MQKNTVNTSKSTKRVGTGGAPYIYIYVHIYIYIHIHLYTTIFLTINFFLLSTNICHNITLAKKPKGAPFVSQIFLSLTMAIADTPMNFAASGGSTCHFGHGCVVHPALQTAVEDAKGQANPGGLILGHRVHTNRGMT